METITMYELLGMVKDGKAPKKIKVGNKIYNYETFNIGKLEKENKKLKNIIKEIRELADKYEMGKYDYNLPVFELKEKYYQIEDIIYNDLSPDKYALVHNYIVNLQLGIEIKTQRIKEEQQEKELYKRSYNELKQNKLSDIDYLNSKGDE